MRIESTNVYVGPNVFALFPVIRHVLDLGELEHWPTGRLGEDFTPHGVVWYCLFVLTFSIRKDRIMKTFIVLTADDKEGTIYPDVIGPFQTHDIAIDFATKHLGDLGGFREPADGGHAGVIYVNDRVATDPQEYIQD